MGKHMDKPEWEWNFSGRSVCCDLAQVAVLGRTTPMLYWQTFMVGGGMVPRWYWLGGFVLKALLVPVGQFPSFGVK